MKFTFYNVLFTVVIITFLSILCRIILEFKSDAKYLLYVFGGLAFVALPVNKYRLMQLFMGAFVAVIIYIIIVT
jgi:hypothetical protein